MIWKCNWFFFFSFQFSSFFSQCAHLDMKSRFSKSTTCQHRALTTDYFMPTIILICTIQLINNRWILSRCVCYCKGTTGAAYIQNCTVDCVYRIWWTIQKHIKRYSETGGFVYWGVPSLANNTGVCIYHVNLGTIFVFVVRLYCCALSVKWREWLGQCINAPLCKKCVWVCKCVFVELDSGNKTRILSVVASQAKENAFVWRFLAPQIPSGKTGQFFWKKKILIGTASKGQAARVTPNFHNQLQQISSYFPVTRLPPRF